MDIVDWVTAGALLTGATLLAVGALRVRAWTRVVPDRRLAALALLFGALAVAFLVQAAHGLLFVLVDPAGVRAGFDQYDLLYWTQHGAWFVALAAGTTALGVPRRPADAGVQTDADVDADPDAPAPRTAPHPAMAVWLLAAEPVLLVVEGGFALYLLLRTAWNHLRRNNVGSLEVALGFALLTASRFLPFLTAPDGPAPLGLPHVATALVMLAAAICLYGVLPRDGRGGRVGG